jgi:hypothetical protein
MLKHLCDINNVLCRLRLQMRFGRLSRKPLELLRLELRGDSVACEWVARAPDPFDRSLPAHISERNATVQALEDAIAVRDLLFRALPHLTTADFRVYRESASDDPELIITGTVTRPEPVRYGIQSLIMRAKMCGFHFGLDDGRLVKQP